MPYEYDPCLRWVAKSSESFDFDVTKTTSSQWCALSSKLCLNALHYSIPNAHIRIVCNLNFTFFHLQLPI